MKKTELINAMNYKLEKLDYTTWVTDNLPYRLRVGVLTPDDVSHIETCLKSLVEKLRNDQYTHGSFVEALAKGNIKEAIINADETNKIAIHVYIIFMTTFIPIGLIKMK